MGVGIYMYMYNQRQITKVQYHNGMGFTFSSQAVDFFVFRFEAPARSSPGRCSVLSEGESSRDHVGWQERWRRRRQG